MVKTASHLRCEQDGSEDQQKPDGRSRRFPWLGAISVGIGVLIVVLKLLFFSGTMTAAQFQKLKPGMSRIEVQGIIGWSDAEEDLTSLKWEGGYSPGVPVHQLGWGGADTENGHNVSAVFEDDHLIAAGGSIKGVNVNLLEPGKPWKSSNGLKVLERRWGILKTDDLKEK